MITTTTKKYLLAAATMALLTGCTGARQADPQHQYLDSSTGITITGLQEPAIFYHDAARVAVHARDYLYMGPVEMNRMGKLSYYLWLAEWSTIDRLPGRQQGERTFTGVVLFLDGVPMELQDGKPSVSYVAEQPYETPVKTGRSVYMRVSQDQLKRIAAADTVTVNLSDDAGKSRPYKLWSGTVRGFGSITPDAVELNEQRVVLMSD